MFVQNGKRFDINRSMEIFGVRYPNFHDPEHRRMIGVEEIPEPIKKDSRFFFVQEIETEPYVLNIPRDLAQCKSDTKSRVKSQCAGLLSLSDWKIIREVEGGEQCDTQTKQYRAAVRLASNTIESVIDACEDVDALAALVITWPKFDDYAPITPDAVAATAETVVDEPAAEVPPQ